MTQTQQNSHHSLVADKQTNLATTNTSTSLSTVVANRCWYILQLNTISPSAIGLKKALFDSSQLHRYSLSPKYGHFPLGDRGSGVQGLGPVIEVLGGPAVSRFGIQSHAVSSVCVGLTATSGKAEGLSQYDPGC